MKTYTIGFTQKNAQRFFDLIKRNHVARIIDVRLNNVSQLAGFAKRDDLKYFLSELCGADYIHVEELAPTKDIFGAYLTHRAQSAGRMASVIWDRSVTTRSGTTPAQRGSSSRRRRERASPANRAVRQPVRDAGQMSLRRSLPT